MVKETKKIVKFNDLDEIAKETCTEQYINVVCPMVALDEEEMLNIGEAIDLFVEATPDQFWFDENGDWYDEGRPMQTCKHIVGGECEFTLGSEGCHGSTEERWECNYCIYSHGCIWWEDEGRTVVI